MNFWNKIARIILRNRLLIIALLVLFTSFMAYHAKDFKIAYRFAKILPDHEQASIDFEKLSTEFGNTSNGIIVAVETGKNGEAITPQFLNNWKNLIDSLQNIEGINSAFSITEAYDITVNDSLEKLELVPLLEQTPQNQEETEKFKTKLLNLPFYKNMLFKDDLSVFLMTINIQEDLVFSKTVTFIVKDVKDVIEKFELENNVNAHISGLPYILFANASKLTKEIKMFIALTLLVTAFLLFWFLKSLRATLISLIVVIIGVISTFGLFGLFNYELSLVGSLIPPLVIVISIPNCIYLINKYHAEYKVHGNKVLALQRVVRRIGYVTLLTNTTTALGFAAFILTDSLTLVEFGIVTSINIFIIFVLSITIIPIIYSYAKPPKQRHYKHLDKKWVQRMINTLEYLVQHRRTWVYISSVIIVAIGVYGIFQLKTTGKLTDDFARHDLVYVDYKFMEQEFGGVVPLDIIIDTKKKNGVNSPKTLKKIDQLQTALRSHDILSRSFSIVDFVKFAKQGFFNGNAEMFSLPTRQERTWIASYMPKGQNKDLLKSIVDSNQQQALVIVQVADIDAPEMKAFLVDLDVIIADIFDPEDYEITVTGASIKFAKATDYLVKNLIISLALAIVVVSIIMAFLFGSARMVFISIVPNLIPLLLTGGIMGLFGIPLKPSTILVFSIAFGISVDDTIHFLAKYRQELRYNNWNISKSVIISLRETGVSMFYTSIVLLAGFSIFMASEFGGSQALGLLVGITLFFAMFANLVILPSFLMTMEKRISSKNFSANIIAEEMEESLKQMEDKQ